MNKKASHIGVVISFGIFLTFIVFAYVILIPKVETDEHENLVEDIKNQMVEEISSRVITVSIKTESDSVTCARIGDFFTNFDLNKTIVVTDEDGNILTSTYSGPSDQHLGITVAGESLFRIYHSGEFSEISSGACAESQNLYGKFIKKEDIVVKSKILTLASDYTNDYGELKSRLNVPSVNNFEFTFTYSDDTETTTEAVEITRGNVYIEEFPIEYIEQADVSTQVGTLRVKVW